MKKFLTTDKISFKKISFVTLIILCVLSLVIFIVTFDRFKKEGDFTISYSIKNHENFNNKHNINEVGVWMTFDYINFIFKLPPDYLKNYLSINDARYPNIKVGHYIRENNLNPAVFIQDIKQAIMIYQNNK